MSNKRVQVSADGGTTWYTLPGNTGDLATSLSKVDDTVFGQVFASSQPILADWKLSTNALFKGVAGYNAVLKKPGSATTMTAEACSLVSGKIYQITSAIKRIISYLDPLTILDNGTDHTADVLSVDYLSGTITFAAGYAPTGPITVTGKYIPLVVMAKSKSFTLAQSCAVIDDSCYDDAQANGGFKTQDRGLNTITLALDSIFEVTNVWKTTALAKGIVYVEIDLDATNTGKTVARGFFKIESHDQQGAQGATEMVKTQMSLWVPDGSLVVQPFGWYFSATPMNTAIQQVINAYANQTDLNIRYLPYGSTDGTSGGTGVAMVSECSLANSVDGQNTFTVAFVGKGALNAV